MMVAVSAGLAIPARGQTSPSTGAIQGLVQDPSGAVVSGAAIALVNPTLGINRTVHSASDGTFLFPLLQPGSGYEITVEHSGFQKARDRKSVV